MFFPYSISLWFLRLEGDGNKAGDEGGEGDGNGEGPNRDAADDGPGARTIDDQGQVLLGQQ